MIDWCIWAPTEAIAKAVVLRSGRKLLDEDGSWILAGPGHAIDVNIPIVVESDAAPLEPGWFANLRITNGEDIEPLLVAAAAAGVQIKHPVTPRRVWA
jgi:hypothetical protein